MKESSLTDRAVLLDIFDWETHDVVIAPFDMMDQTEFVLYAISPRFVEGLFLFDIFLNQLRAKLVEIDDRLDGAGDFDSFADIGIAR